MLILQAPIQNDFNLSFAYFSKKTKEPGGKISNENSFERVCRSHFFGPLCFEKVGLIYMGPFGGFFYFQSPQRGAVWAIWTSSKNNSLKIYEVLISWQPHVMGYNIYIQMGGSPKHDRFYRLVGVFLRELQFLDSFTFFCFASQNILYTTCVLGCAFCLELLIYFHFL